MPIVSSRIRRGPPGITAISCAAVVWAFVAIACSQSPSATPVPSQASSPTPLGTRILTPSPATELAPSPTATAMPLAATEMPPTATSITPAATALLPTATAVVARVKPTPTASARYGGTLNLVSRQGIEHQDIHQEVSPALATWGPGIAYSRLLRLKSGPEVELPSLVVECELCDSWEMVDSRTFLFHLRSDVRWQGLSPLEGRVLNSGDVVFSYNRQRDLDGPNAPLLQSIQVLEAPDPFTLSITLAAPDADFLVSLADGHSKIAAQEAVDVHGDLRQGPTIGTGPWVLTSTLPDAHSFVANPDYFEEGRPFVENLRIHVILDETTRKAAFEVALVDLRQMEPAEWGDFRRRHPNAPFLATREPGTGMDVAFKTSTPPFDDVRLRRAVFQAMDPWRANQDLWLGAAFVSAGLPVVEPSWLLADKDLQQFFGSPELARRLIEESGTATPILVSVKVGDFGQSYLAHARRITDEMRQVGFEPTVEVLSRRAYGDEVWLGGDYQMFAGPSAPTITPNGYLLPVLHSQGLWNTTEHEDAELDRLIVSQALEPNIEKRRELVRSIQLQVLANAYRAMPATRVSIWTWWPRVRNFHPNFAAYGYSHWAQVWVEE